MEVEYDVQPFRPYVIRIKDEKEHKHLNLLLKTARSNQMSYTAETISFIDGLQSWINGPLEPENGS